LTDIVTMGGAPGMIPNLGRLGGIRRSGGLRVARGVGSREWGVEWLLLAA
jgi:hypothetical protein